MCEPQRSGGGRAAAAIMVIGGLAVVAYLADPTGAPAKPPAAVKPAVVHTGIPWWVYGLSALVLVVLAVAATLLVQRVRRREPVPPPVVRPVRQRALTSGPQPELTTSARAWLGEEKTEVKR